MRVNPKIKMVLMYELVGVDERLLYKRLLDTIHMGMRIVMLMGIKYMNRFRDRMVSRIKLGMLLGCIFRFRLWLSVRYWSDRGIR